MSAILVTGANGQLGSELKELASDTTQFDFTFTDVGDLDITDEDTVAAFLKNNSFDFCINCAAYTAVDKAESEMEKAFLLNAEAAGIMARQTHEQDVKLVHISTDFVFDGRHHIPYKEDEQPAPLNIYGKSKWRGEEACLEHNPDSLVLRTSWLYSSYGNNFVKTMRRLGDERDEISVIYDQIGTPTYAHDLAVAILKILPELNDNNFGLYHYSNEGVCSWYDFAVAVIKLSQLNCHVEPIETWEYPTPAKRGAYTVLNKKKVKEAFGITIPHWQASLEKCIAKIEKDA